MGTLQSLDVVRRSATTTAPPQIREKISVTKLIDLSKCIGCKACQAACLQWNDLRDEVGTMKDGTYNNPLDLTDTTWTVMRFYEKEIDGKFHFLSVKDGCMHCAEPGCLASCPAPGAIIQYSNGIVNFQQSECIGCGYCNTGCPFNIPRISSRDSKAYKCTLCVDRIAVGQAPACAKTCPTSSINFGSREDMLIQAEHRVETLKAKGYKDAFVYNPSGVGGTHVIYVMPYGKASVYGLPDNPGTSFAVGIWRGWFTKSLGVFTMFAVLLAGIFHYFKVGPYEVDESKGDDHE